MSDRYQSSVSLLPENDPCTVTYQRSSCADPKPPVKVAFIRSIKRIFGIKSKDSTTFVMMSKNSSSFVTPTEYKRLSRSSMRSRRLSTKMTNSASPIPVPSVYVTASSPSIRRKRSYRVHSYNGAGSPPMATKGSVRFSHPVVSSMKASAAQSAPNLLTVPEDDDDNGAEEKRDRRISSATDDSISSSFQSSSLRDSGPPPVRPKQMWRWSAQSVTTDGFRESYGDFKDRLDGHKPRADRQSTGERPPSLQFIPRMASIKLHEDKTSPTKADAKKHRSDALSALEGVTTSSTQDRYVLAIMPKKDLPITAIQVSSNQYPSSLIPGNESQAHPPMQRPHTFHGPAQTKRVYQAYSPSPSPPLADANSSSKTDLPSRKRYRKQRIFDSQELLDMPKFDSDGDADLGLRHSKHYRDVESGTFDDAKVISPQVHAPIPQSPAKPEPRLTARSSFLLSPSPPSPASKPAQTAPKMDKKQKGIMRKPVTVPPRNASKALSTLPTKTSSTDKAVKPISMNANGYPCMTAHPSKRYSADAKYQKRSVDVVEAKYRKDHPKQPKRTKTESKASQQGAGPEKPNRESKTALQNAEPKKAAKLQKSSKGIGEKEKQKFAELRVFDEQLKKLMCA